MSVATTARAAAVLPLLEAVARSLAGQDAAEAQLAQVRAIELPQARQEAWRYFPLRQVQLKRFAGSGPAEVAAAAIAGDAIVLEWRGGDASEPAGLQQLTAHGIEASTWPAAGIAASSAFQRLTELGCAGGLCLRLTRSLDRPLVLRQWAARLGASAFRLRLELAPGVRAEVIEQLAGPQQGEAWIGSQLEVLLEQGASASWLRLLGDGPDAVRTASSRFELAPAAALHWYGHDHGVGIARHELTVRLAGHGASARVHGGGLLDGREYSEHRLALEHAVPGSDSSTLWKLVGRGKSRAVFNGRIEISAGADQTDARLKTASLLLSEQAEIDVKPELEIHADEVSASHGATVGQLDERALFYLRSRGIGVAEARALLTQAFLRELYDELPEGLSLTLLESTLQARLPSLDVDA